MILSQKEVTISKGFEITPGVQFSLELHPFRAGGPDAFSGLVKLLAPDGKVIMTRTSTITIGSANRPSINEWLDAGMAGFEGYYLEYALVKWREQSHVSLVLEPTCQGPAGHVDFRVSLNRETCLGRFTTENLGDTTFFQKLEVTAD